MLSRRSLLCWFLILVSSAATAAEPAADGWQSLFDGKSLDGWKINENPATWKIEEGAIVCQGERSHLFYVGDDQPFVNFEFQADVMTRQGSNAGIYFHTQFQETGWPKAGLEAQVNNTQSDPKRTASLYGLVDITKAPAQDDTWFTMHVKVDGKRVVISVDGKQLVDYTEPEGKGPSTPDFARTLGSGTFALQGHDPGSKVYFKNLKVKRLP